MPVFSICRDMIIITCLFDYDDVRAFKVFKWTAGCSFKFETRKMSLPKNTQKMDFYAKSFLYNVIFYQILTCYLSFWKFLTFSFKQTQSSIKIDVIVVKEHMSF